MSVTPKWRLWLRTRSKTQASRKPVRLGIEALEDRAVPAVLNLPVPPQVPLTLTVTSIADSGAGTLREAIDIANANAATADTIQFAPQLQGAVIDLSTIASNTYGPSALDVSGPVTIVGSGQTIEAPSSPYYVGPTFRLFAVEPKATLNLQNLTLANGLAKGGNGYNGGGGAAGLGGAIYNCGELDLIACTLAHNTAVGGQAGSSLWLVGYGGGGGLAGNGDVNGNGGGPHGGVSGIELNNGMVQPGTNGGFGGGGAVGDEYLIPYGANPTIDISKVQGKMGGFGGGGGDGGVILRELSFDNYAGNGGNGGFGGGGGGGAAVSSLMGTPPTTGGVSKFGGGAGHGAGGSGGGGAAMGGAVFNQGGKVFAVNSTFALNSVLGGNSNNAIGVSIAGYYLIPAGDGGSAFGAGLCNLDGDMTLVNCTVASNDAVAGHGTNWGIATGTAICNLSLDAGLPPPVLGSIYVPLDGNGMPINPPAASNASTDANLNLYNNILIGAVGKAAVYNFGDPSGNGQVNGIYNLLSSPVSDVGDAVTDATYIVGNIQLGPLQNNGGPTPTMMPPASAPLGSTFYFNSLNIPGGVPANDQRGTGYARVVNNQVNLGAVQVQANHIVLTPPRIVSRVSGGASNALSDVALVDLLFALQRR